MGMNVTPLEEVEAMARHEEAIAELYETFAEVYPDHEEFWSKIAREERMHAEWVRKFKKLCEEQSCTINSQRFNPMAIETSIGYIRGYIKTTKQNPPAELWAASISLDIENALIDRKFFEIYETDDEDLKKTLKSLLDSSEEHRLRVKEFLDSLKLMH